jgi:hypothetical protein
MKRDYYPDCSYKTLREFQKKKRRDLDAVLKVLDEAMLGCAYFPQDGYVKFMKALNLLREIRKSLRTREWK